ncbi:cysteine hydrolase family protein [Thalassorhabdus alkalitolerans]|uniref:Cysteine hydrolase family protein n=1 Tax=Thalassorhabdus alkalitolerans TaxID=2282697 RepID=A0ABW0YSE6_9BACI
MAEHKPVDASKESEDNPEHVPEKASVALLLIDTINDMEFEDGEKLFEQSLPAAKKIAKLKRRVKAYDVPVIYVNDNYGRWQSDFRQLVDHCLENNVRGKPIVELLLPEDDDYFVLKPQFSAFFATPLDLLLDYLEVKTLIIAGFAGNMCVHFTVNDAYMRHYQTIVPSDCTASNTEESDLNSLEMMHALLKTNITSSDELDLVEIIQKANDYFKQQRK